jgi:hypothetical protein
MPQSAYYQRVKVNACCFITSSLPGIYKSLTDYCYKYSLINQAKKKFKSQGILWNVVERSKY